MALSDNGRVLIEQLRTHVLAVLRTIPECRPEGPGLGNAEIERRSGLDLHLDKQDHWRCWSVLKTLQRDKAVETIGSPTRWRLKIKA
jgi:hypothetical protein